MYKNNAYGIIIALTIDKTGMERVSMQQNFSDLSEAITELLLNGREL